MGNTLQYPPAIQREKKIEKYKLPQRHILVRERLIATPNLLFVKYVDKRIDTSIFTSIQEQQKVIKERAEIDIV